MSALPERFARADHYEFTYEIQYVTVPWARERGIPLCPFDWLPQAEDSALAFGTDDLERPPLLRPLTGFQSFLSFPDATAREGGVFFAEAEAERARYRAFYRTYPDDPRRDAARRLFLYRTFMQAQRIARAARVYRGKRLLVVVGTMHKEDIERILAGDPELSIVQPSQIAAEPTSEDIARHQRLEDLFAIATFNLLGVQSLQGKINVPWLEHVIDILEHSSPGFEVDLLATRLGQLKHSVSAATALQAYSHIAEMAGEQQFTWTGVKDASRLDSFFDPFGGLTVAQRAQVEMARLQYSTKHPSEAESLRERLLQEVSTPLKRAQLTGYWATYVAGAVVQAR